ncbi:hypothetical protein LY76DRAFT_650534 [Colletotrichum caudatum]|nr:hypothetical protein LY76DRAFT_650534 [Colletotrichum caudatum]
MNTEASPEESRSDIAEMRTQHQHLYGSATASNRCWVPAVSKGVSRPEMMEEEEEEEEEEVDVEEDRPQVRNREWCRFGRPEVGVREQNAIVPLLKM